MDFYYRLCPCLCVKSVWICGLPGWTTTLSSFDLNVFMCFSVLDLNECLAKPAVCKNGRCENTVGSFRCRCDQGFVANPTQTECIGTYVVHHLHSLLVLCSLGSTLIWIQSPSLKGSLIWLYPGLLRSGLLYWGNEAITLQLTKLQSQRWVLWI